jgi:hypothetical protein
MNPLPHVSPFRASRSQGNHLGGEPEVPNEPFSLLREKGRDEGEAITFL